MTTIVSPGSSPVPVYNKSGVTVESITAAASPVTIVRYAGTTVVLVDNDGDPANAVTLPSDADIGDIVETYAIASGSGFTLHANSGANFPILGSSSVGVGNIFIVRKVSATAWAVMNDE